MRFAPSSLTSNAVRPWEHTAWRSWTVATSIATLMDFVKRWSVWCRDLWRRLKYDMSTRRNFEFAVRDCRLP